MCTIGRISGGTARETYHCGNRKEGALRHGKKETDCGTQRCRNSFLNATFLPISPSELFTDGTDGKPHNLITQENYEYLRDSFFRYALLMKKEAVHTPGRTPGESIARLHEEMCNLVGNDMNVNIEQDEERLLFRLWKCHEWGELTLYYFPTKFMERLGPELRRISVTFIHNLMQANGINTILDEDDMDYALTLMSEDDSGETASDRKKRRRLLHSYEEGRIHALLRRVERKSYYKNLPKAIDRYKPKDGYEQSLLSVMKGKYSINSLVYWVTYVHNVVYSFYRSMIYCYINSTQRCAGSIVIDIIPTNGADKRKFFPFAPYFPVTNVIKRYFYPYFPAIIGIKGYSFPYFPYLSGIMKIKTALYSLFSRLDWHKTVVFPCLGEIYEGIRSLSWEIPVT